MNLIKKFINIFLKIFNLKLIKIVDQFDNSFRLALALKENKIDYVLDIGANDGQFVKQLRYYGYKDEVISFEPLLSAHAKLKEDSLNDDKWHVYKPVAIGNKNGKNEINISKNSVSSSILNINQIHIQNAPESYFIGKQTVDEKKLEDIFYEIDIKDKKLFLKIDAQGYEYQILEGASKILNKINGILVEVSLIELYEGQKKWLDIVKFIENNGFSLWSVDRGFTNKKNGRTLQVDMCFFKGK